MIRFYDKARTHPQGRLHPYAAAESNHSGFVDFALHPELIETCLEDFKPLAHTSAVKTFYSFLRWINGPTSHLATCDCALRPPTTHNDTNSTYRLCVHGRVYILFRELTLNASLQHSDWLCGMIMAELETIDPNFPATKGVVALTKQPALQLAISNGLWQEGRGFLPGENDPGFGHHLMLTFWGYGDSEEEAFGNLELVFRNIWSACQIASQFMQQSLEADKG